MSFNSTFKCKSIQCTETKILDGKNKLFQHPTLVQDTILIYGKRENLKRKKAAKMLHRCSYRCLESLYMSRSIDLHLYSQSIDAGHLDLKILKENLSMFKLI